MEKSKDFEELFGLLNQNNVKYLLVGGYAFAIHAEPRYTKDIDIFYKADRKNVRNLQKAINDFGFSSLNISMDDYLNPGRVIQLGMAPYRIDLMNEIDGVSYDNAWKNRIQSKYGDQTIHVICKEDLIKNKKATGRERDLLDVKEIEKFS